MTDELQDKLFKDFPKIFPNGKDVDVRANLMCFGFECGDGWYNIIYDLCDHLQKHIDGYSLSDRQGVWKPTQLVVVQVKEKYGSLRFYNNGCSLYCEELDEHRIDPISRGIVAHACYISARTCEQCGKRGKRYTSGWHVTLCDEHAKERGRFEDG